MMRFIFITGSPELAAFVAERGVDRIMVDLELLGKVERQGHLSTVISRHSFDDVAAVRAAAPHSELMVRINPLHEGTAAEVDRAIALGSDILMLPMFRTAADVERFSNLVAGRNRICLLLETADAASAIEQIVAVPGVDEIHIGLNDLHLDLGQAFMLQPVAEGMVDAVVSVIARAGMPFGIGGIARVGEGLVPAELLLAEHVRLHSTAAILSRTFHRNYATVAEIEKEMDFAGEIVRLRQAYAEHTKATPDSLGVIHRQLQQRVAEIVRAKSLVQ